MPVLAYCLAPPVEITAIPPGADGARVEAFELPGLRCYFSEHQEFATSAEALRPAALAYHAVVQEVFAVTTVIPFRFPTLLPSASELRRQVEERASDYGSAVVPLAGTAQMEINIQAPGERGSATSGIEYLRARQQATH